MSKETAKKLIAELQANDELRLHAGIESAAISGYENFRIVLMIKE